MENDSRVSENSMESSGSESSFSRNGNRAEGDRGYRPRGGAGGSNFGGGNWKRQNFYKKKDCPVESGVISVDYKDSRALQKFTSERGKVFPRRISSVSAKGQRKLAVAIKRARFLALLPYTAD